MPTSMVGQGGIITVGGAAAGIILTVVGIIPMVVDGITEEVGIMAVVGI